MRSCGSVKTDTPTTATGVHRTKSSSPEHVSTGCETRATGQLCVCQWQAARRYRWISRRHRRAPSATDGAAKANKAGANPTSETARPRRGKAPPQGPRPGRGIRGPCRCPTANAPRPLPSPGPRARARQAPNEPNHASIRRHDTAPGQLSRVRRSTRTRDRCVRCGACGMPCPCAQNVPGEGEGETETPPAPAVRHRE